MTQTQMMENPHKLIHAATFIAKSGKKRYLFLRKKDDRHFAWFEEVESEKEQETPVFAETVEEAIRLARREWKQDSFSTLICGFRYMLPERDEHGINALFHQMNASNSSMNGIYFDEELGNNCFVQNASIEARRLGEQLKKQGRL